MVNKDRDLIVKLNDSTELVMPFVRCPFCNSELVNEHVEIKYYHFPATRQNEQDREIPYLLVGCDNCGKLLHISRE